MRVKVHRDDGSIMGPMFEQATVFLIKPLQMSRTVTGTARKQDQIVGARDRVDAVQLNKPQIFDDTLQIGALARSGGLISQPMAIQEYTARGPCIQLRARHQSAAAQRIAVANRRRQSDDLFQIAIGVLKLGRDDLRGLAPDLNPARIHRRQLAWQSLQQLHPVEPG